VKIGAHANICRYTEIGDGTVVHMGAVLGNTPQDLAFKDEPSYLKIGKGNVIREYATLHRAQRPEDSTMWAIIIF
jgi:UDP-N-acetylglucosamine acyltransferase